MYVLTWLKLLLNQFTKKITARVQCTYLLLQEQTILNLKPILRL